jgi:hypothetical protein
MTTKCVYCWDNFFSLKNEQFIPVVTFLTPLASSPEWENSKGSIGHAFAVRIRTGNRNQTSFYPSVLHEISVPVELVLGHLRYLLTDVPPQPNSPPDCVFNLDPRGRGGEALVPPGSPSRLSPDPPAPVAPKGEGTRSADGRGGEGPEDARSRVRTRVRARTWGRGAPLPPD